MTSRILILPAALVAICVATWICLTSIFPDRGADTSKEASVSNSLAGFFKDQRNDGKTYVGLDTIKKKMITQWNESRATGRRFEESQYWRATGNIDYRPRRVLYVPIPRFSDYQPSPESVFFGSFDLERNQTTLSFPFLADRQSGRILICARGKWWEFEKWTISKKGVHR